MFGDVVDNQVLLNGAGVMVNNWWNKITEKFPHIELDEYIIMPNHMHGIIIVGADLCVGPIGLNTDPYIVPQQLESDKYVDKSGGHAVRSYKIQISMSRK